MDIRPVAFRVSRFDPAEDDQPVNQTYTLDVPEGMMVLEALLRIQAEQDGTLAFRYACRGAVCGLCAMMTNGREELACRTQIHGLLEEERTAYLGPTRMGIGERAEDRHTITVEPLRNLRMIKDLAVDMEPFFGKLDAVEPWPCAHEPPPEREHLVGPDQSAEAEPYTNCVLCGCCYSACPVVAEDPLYLGPAALAQKYRFLADVRDAADEKRLALVAGEHGVAGCEFVWNCVRIFPKGVPPTKGIAKTWAHITRERRTRERKG